MTTYTAIIDAEIDTDSPVTESLMTRMRDNPVAISEGATGAPKIANAAFSDGTIEAARLVDESVTFLTQMSSPASVGSTSITSTPVTSTAGVLNIELIAPAGASIFAEIYVNGAWNTLYTASNTASVFGQIISDGINVRFRTNSGTGTLYYVEMFD